MPFHLFLCLEVLDVLDGIATVYFDLPAFHHLTHTQRHLLLSLSLKEIHIEIARVVFPHLVQHIV